MRRRLLAGLTAAGCALGGGVAVTGQAQAAPPPTTGGRSVTLISGDRVELGGDGSVRVTPGPGRQGMRFLRQSAGREQFVIPADAMAPLARGTVDRRLFDITTITAEAGDDRADSHVPVVIRYREGAAGDRARTAVRGAAHQEKTLAPTVRMYGTQVPKSSAGGLWSRVVAESAAGTGGILKVWLDGVARVQLDKSVAQIGAPTAWQAGFTGKDVKVAVLDTGYDPTHPDLKDAVVGSKDFVADEPEVTDKNGHGTHVSSTVAGSGAASDGKYKGVAPGAKLLVGKICNVDGNCTQSDIIAGMNWAVEQGARVVNLSLGYPDTPGVDPMEEAVNTLTAKTGALFVVAAGNVGRNYAVDSPASADAALAVASVDRTDKLADSSSRGPRIGDGGLKPEIAAPGTKIVAARAAGTEGEGSYVAMSGTSMATPHIVGAAAILAQQHPDWKAPQLKAALMDSAAPAEGGVFGVGAGRVDVARAIAQPVTVAPASASFGLQKWPQTTADRRTQKLTVTNPTAAPVTLALDLAVSGPGGAAVPAGMFGAPAQVTVPANGTAGVAVTAESPASAPYGLYAGLITATSADGKLRLRVPVGLEREPESYDHTITLLDRAGKPTSGSITLNAVPMPAEEAPRVIDVAAGKATVRLPRGHWTLTATFLADAGAAGGAVVMGALPDVDSKDHQNITFDGRQSQLIATTVPEPSARLAQGEAGFEVGPVGSARPVRTVMATDGTATAQLYAIPTATTTAREFQFYVHTVWAKPSANGFENSPYTYNVLRPVQGGIPKDLKHSVTKAELATVVSDFGRGDPGETVSEMWSPAIDQFVGGYSAPPMAIPGTRTAYLTTAGNRIHWSNSVYFSSRGEHYDERIYQAGRSYQQQWNRPTYGPAMPGWAWQTHPMVFRYANTIQAQLPLFSDGGDGHYGFSPVRDAKVELFRADAKVAEAADLGFASLTVPDAEPSTYRLVARGSLDPALGVPGAVNTVEWTFRSGQVAGSVQGLPVSVVRFRPAVDAAGAAPAGRFEIPLEVQGAPGGVRDLTVETSVDGGTTWRRATVTTAYGSRTAVVLQAGAPGTRVSLRAKLTRTDGGTTIQTQLNAYRLR